MQSLSWAGAPHDGEVALGGAERTAAHGAQRLDAGERVGRVVAAEGGVEQQAVLQHVVVGCGFDIRGAAGS